MATRKITNNTDVTELAVSDFIHSLKIGEIVPWR